MRSSGIGYKTYLVRIRILCTDFAAAVDDAYATGGWSAIDLGLEVLGGAIAPEAGMRAPLRMMNRHGLIAGATGAVKTRTLRGLFGLLRKRV